MKRHVWVVVEHLKTHLHNPCPGGGTDVLGVAGSYAACKTFRPQYEGELEFLWQEVISIPRVRPRTQGPRRNAR